MAARRRITRARAGQEVLTITHGLMDGLLAEENRCFDGIEDAAADLAAVLGKQLRSISSPAGLVRGARTLVASLVDLRERFSPPVGDLMATVRERTLDVLGQQLELCASAVSVDAAPAVQRGRLQAEGVCVDLERYWLGRYQDAVVDTATLVRGEMTRQLRTWQSRGEDRELLVVRWCSPDRVTLPGAGVRGAVFGMRAPLCAAARTASVACVNGVLLGGYAGWNLAAEDSRRGA